MSAVKRFRLRRVGAGPGHAIFACEHLLGADVLVVDAADYAALAKAGDILAHQLRFAEYPSELGGWWRLRGAECTYCNPPSAAESVMHAPTCPVAQPGFVLVDGVTQCNCDFGQRLAAAVGVPYINTGESHDG